MSVIISKDQYRTIIATANKKYIINETPSKGIELLIEPIMVTGRSSDNIIIRMWIPVDTKTPKGVTENATEVAIYPIPLKVIEEIQERTKGDIEVEDLSEYYEETEVGKEFFFRIKGYIMMTTM